MSWKQEDFSQYHKAGLAQYAISDNGKVDISVEKEGKIGLEPFGMLKLVKDWLKTKNSYFIRREEKEELIRLLSK